MYLLDEVDGQSAGHGEEHEERQEEGLLEVALVALAVGRRHLVQHLGGGIIDSSGSSGGKKGQSVKEQKLKQDTEGDHTTNNTTQVIVFWVIVGGGVMPCVGSVGHVSYSTA